MKKSSVDIRRSILRRLYSHLEEHYAITIPDSSLNKDSLSLHQLDALLAFKSDPHLDDLRAALDRLEEGTFGVCLSCKVQIEEGLMDIDPTRRMCDRCERVYSRVTRRRENLTLSTSDKRIRQFGVCGSSCCPTILTFLVPRLLEQSLCPAQPPQDCFGVRQRCSRFDST